jgi:hypothetical protein
MKENTQMKRKTTKRAVVGMTLNSAMSRGTRPADLFMLRSLVDLYRRAAHLFRTPVTAAAAATATSTAANRTS